MAWVGVASAAVGAGAHAGTDPVLDYLKRFSPIGGGPRFFSDDTLLRLEVDLDGDTQKEVLLSIDRDRNGKQGNGWSVFKKQRGFFKLVGGVTFNDGKAFVGAVEELGRHGLVTFWSSGAGEGSLIAYTLEKGDIQETKIGALEWDQTTNSMRGEALFERYFGAKQREHRPVAEEVSASEFGPKYGIPVVPMTYGEFLNLSDAEQKSISSRYAPSDDGFGKRNPGTVEASETGVEWVPTENSESKGGAAKAPVGVVRDLLLAGALVSGLAVAHLILRSRRAGGGS